MKVSAAYRGLQKNAISLGIVVVEFYLIIVVLENLLISASVEFCIYLSSF